MFCKKFRFKFKQLVGQFDKLVEANIDTALSITTGIKKFLKGAGGDILTVIIPGTADDVARVKIIAVLEKTIDALEVVNTCKDAPINEKLECFVREVSLRSPDQVDAVLAKLASLLASELDGKRLRQALYDLYTQAEYTRRVI